MRVLDLHEHHVIIPGDAERQGDAEKCSYRGTDAGRVKRGLSKVDNVVLRKMSRGETQRNKKDRMESDGKVSNLCIVIYFTNERYKLSTTPCSTKEIHEHLIGKS